VLDRLVYLPALFFDLTQGEMRRSRWHEFQAALKVDHRGIRLAKLVFRDTSLQMVIEEIVTTGDRAIVVGHGHVVLLVYQAHVAS